MRSKATFIANTEAELEEIAKEILLQFPKCRVFALTGEIGAGKTAFVKALGNVLKIEDFVNSPTFSIINDYVYRNANNEQLSLYHMDLYRLKSIDEAVDIGIEDYLEGTNYCFIEWPEIIESLLPLDSLQLKFETTSPLSRKISVY